MGKAEDAGAPFVHIRPNTLIEANLFATEPVTKDERRLRQQP
jgi:hypothetical protein